MRISYPQLKYQLNDNELEAFELLLKEVESAETLDAFDVGINKAIDALSDQSSEAWFLSLKESMSDRIKSILEEGEIIKLKMVFFDWFNDIDFDYYDLVDNKINGLEGVKEGGNDINALHMGWLIEMDAQLKSYLSEPDAINERDAFIYFWQHKNSGITPKTFSMLLDMRLKSNHLAMTMEQYINYYKRSLKNMDGDLFSRETSIEMTKYIKKQLESGSNLERINGTLIRRFKVHPAHREALNNWCENMLSLHSKNTALDDSGLTN